MPFFSLKDIPGGLQNWGVEGFSVQHNGLSLSGGKPYQQQRKMLEPIQETF